MEGKPKLVLALKGQLFDTVFLPFDQGLSVRNKCTKSMFKNFYRKYFKSVTIYAICLFTSIECTGNEQWKPAWHYCFLTFKTLFYSIVYLFQGCADKLEDVFRNNLLYFLIFSLCTVVVGIQYILFITKAHKQLKVFFILLYLLQNCNILCIVEFLC